MYWDFYTSANAAFDSQVLNLASASTYTYTNCKDKTTSKSQLE